MSPVDEAPICFDGAERQVSLDIDLIIRTGRVKRARRTVGVGSTIIAVVAVATVVPVLSFGRHHPPSARASAATVFQHAAVAASKQANVTGTYWFRSIRNDQGFLSQQWTASNGHITVYFPALKTHAQAPGLPNVTGGPGSETWQDLAELPTDPARLRTTLETTRGAGAGAGAVFYKAIELLEGTPGSPALRSALFQVCAELPGVVNDGPTRDDIGRLGTELTLSESRPNDPSVVGVILNQSTGNVLESFQTIAGHPESSSTVIDSGWVKSIGAVPPAP